MPERSPEHTVRVSPRAKRVTLRFSLEAGLVVVVPRRFDRSAIPAILSEKAAWIARHEARLAAERALLAADPPSRLPDLIVLPALAEEWAVEYHSTRARSVAVRETRPEPREGRGESYEHDYDVKLRASGAVSDALACRAALQRWLSRRARERLVPWLEELSRAHRLPFAQATVRAQASRWASCSGRGSISLNRALLFLAPELAEYVMLHELCHTLRLDHSPAFWAEVRRREPETDRLRRELRHVHAVVPGWARERVS